MAYKPHQGRFKPKNKHKYKGNAYNIIYRSGLELRLMSYLDDHPDVLQWESEEFFIPYVSPLDNKVHRYFIDFRVTMKLANGEIVKRIIEVKPSSQCGPPKLREKKKVTPKYIKEVETWAVNEAKWKAARKWCEKHDHEFQIITERDLGIKY